MPPKSNKKAEDDAIDAELFGDADLDAELLDDESVDEALFGKAPLRAKKKLAEVSGTEAGPPAPARLRGGPPRREPSAWDIPIEMGKNALAFAEGASFNTADEVGAFGQWLGGKLGITDEERALGEIVDDYNERVNKKVAEYPYGHAAGRLASNLALGLAGPAATAGQAAIAGSTGALGSYAQNRDPLDALISGGIDATTAGLFAYGGNRLAKVFGKPRAVAEDDALVEAAAEGALRERPRTGPSGPDYGTPTPPPPSETPRPLPVARGPGYDPLAAPPQAAPSPARVAADVPDDLRDPVVRTALEMFTPTLKARSTPGDLAEWATKVKEHKLPPAAEKALLRAWTDRVKETLPGVDPERLMRGEEADLVAYTLGEFEAMASAAPRVRGGTPVAAPDAPPYQVGDLKLDPPAPRSEAPRPSVRELREVALRQARDEMPPSMVRSLLGLGARAAPTGTMRGVFKAADLGRRMLGGGVREYAAREGGTMVPNAAVRTGFNMLGRGAMPFSTEANAQDGEQTAYGDAPTLNYAVSAVLHAGRTGLSQADEATLTEAVVTGNQDAINAADFRLRQRYPAYARRVERELRALNEED